jgi:hypothetical protein
LSNCELDDGVLLLTEACQPDKLSDDHDPHGRHNEVASTRVTGAGDEADLSCLSTMVKQLGNRRRTRAIRQQEADALIHQQVTDFYSKAASTMRSARTWQAGC